MGLLLKGMSLNEGWVGVFTNYGFGYAFFFFWRIFFMGMLIHSSFMYEDKQNLKQDSKKAWILSMTAGVGITGWMFIYGYYSNFL